MDSSFNIVRAKNTDRVNIDSNFMEEYTSENSFLVEEPKESLDLIRHLKGPDLVEVFGVGTCNREGFRFN